MQIRTIRALKDNYCYLVIPEGARSALVIDPSEAAPIDEVLGELDLTLGLVLNTHHHHDHVGGNLELRERWKCGVYCSKRDFQRVPGATKGFSDGERFTYAGLTFSVLAIPGHTEGQIAFHVGDALFVGDTVFEMGCGRLFEGTPEQMFASLARIQALPPETRLFFGHEYAEINARFAKKIEPSNAAIDLRLADVRVELKREGFSSAPTIADEQTVNPFFRAKDPAEFARRRAARNSFSG